MKLTVFIATIAALLLGMSSLVVRGENAEGDSRLGEKVYRESCSACHGLEGNGRGQAASTLKTKPRDFTTGIYKFRSTPSGSLPLDQDILRTIAKGVRASSMLPQLHLSEEERQAVVQYIKSFSLRFKERRAEQPISIPPRPPPDKALIALGKTLYKEAGCPSCHGLEGKGDGPSAEGLKDYWGFPIRPADLTLKPFKSGPGPEDLYRTLSAGLDGTPMPSYADSLTPEERWGLVFYILSSRRRSDREG